jgi:molecular chaperone GrpE
MMSQNEMNNEDIKEEIKEEVNEEAGEEVTEDAISEEPENSEPETSEPSSEEIIEDLKAQLEKAKNDFARAYADTENMKKRLQKEADNAKKYRFQQAGLELLPILDSMALALNVQTENEEVLNYVKGFEMIQSKLIQVLEREGVKEIDALNKPFDHNTMQALMQEEVEGVESGIVIEVLQKGYMLKDRILRPALVKVSE